MPTNTFSNRAFLAAAVAATAFTGGCRSTASGAPLVLGQASPATIHYAEQMSRLIAKRDIPDLAKLKPARPVGPGVARLVRWQKRYVALIMSVRKQRQAQYSKDVAQAHKLMTAHDYEGAMVNLLGAYRITGHPTKFRHEQWVLAMSGALANHAAAEEKAGQWLQSLSLYTDLNSLYKISCRYKVDKQRLDRRTTLLAVYTPKQLYKMQKAIIAKQIKETRAMTGGKTKPEIGPAKHPLAPTFSSWRREIMGIHKNMLTKTLSTTEHYWVSPVSYNTLVAGGVNALRLFLTTPPLRHAFPRLANPADRRRFARTLDEVMSDTKRNPNMTGDQMRRLTDKIMKSDAATVRIPPSVVTMEFTNGSMDRLDPFSMVIWPYQVMEFDKEIAGRFTGIGIQISLQNGLLRVVSPLKGTPAFAAGVESGDVLTSIDGKSTANITINQAVHDITGRPGTYVHLLVRRPGVAKLMTFKVERERIHVRSVKGFRRNDQNDKWRYMIDPNDKIAYIRVTGFQRDTATELRTVLKRLKRQGVRGVVLDLRFNPGGLLETAVKMCNMFLDRGTIVSTRNRVGRRHIWMANRDPLVKMNMPLIVLVNQYSASASEIFTGAMRDLKRALIIGHRSYGKGSVQHLIPLDASQRALLKLTMAYYYLPDGECLHRFDHSRHWGVKPGVTVELTPAQLMLLRAAWRQQDIIPVTHPSPQQKIEAAKIKPLHERAFDTQLDTAILMMRLQLAQQSPA